MDGLRYKYEEQCRELNMDRDTEENAWKKYVEVTQRFKLEGDNSHWFCCALYASCREAFTPTVGNAHVIGNCVSLTKLLRCCNISIYEFLSKIKKWHDMANLSNDFKKQIDNLERNFSLTFFVCTQFTKIFPEIFLTTINDKKCTKFRTSVAKCSYQKLCDFTWCLYLCAKNECDTDDLDQEISFNLLICCIDLIYRNVFYEKRIDLINPKFKCLPAEQTATSPPIDEMPCIIEELAGLVNVEAKDAKHFKDTKWQIILQQLFAAKSLYGNKETLLELISNHNFERSWKSLNAVYEQHILGIGAFDERILLNIQSLSAVDYGNGSCGGGDSVGRSPYEQNDFSNNILSLSPEQSQRLFTADADGGCGSGAGAAGDKLKKLLEVTKAPLPLGILCNASEAVLQRIEDMYDELSSELSSTLHGKEIAQLVKPLYFQLLEKIVRVEVNNKPYIKIESFLDKDAFNTTLFVCCVEIVFDAYNCDLKFPWTLKFFKIDGFVFSKIIELVVARHENILNRLHVKHLNFVEESCLESLAWLGTSTIWDAIKLYGGNNGDSDIVTIPAWADVDKNNLNLQPETVKKDLFNARMKPSADEAATNTTPTKDQSMIMPSTSKSAPTVSSTTTTPNRKTASLLIFLRKFYKLAWHRLKELCGELNLQTEIYLNKIWTLFEYSITQRCTQLLHSRHLDQLIMCAVYIYIRVAEVNGINFTEIMKAYRKQPQSLSATYRHVLIQVDSETRVPKYNDLIYYYNTVYVKQMTPYALDFSNSRINHSKLLTSPHPNERQSLPKKIFNNHKIFVSPMEKLIDNIQLSPDPLIYGIGKSPAKELRKMNDVVRQGKRNLPFNDDCYSSDVFPPEPKYVKPTHLNSIAVVMKDRQAESFST